MGYLLICGRPNGMPQTQALIRKSRCHRTCDACHQCHQSRPGRVVKLPHVSKVPPWHNQGMARMKLPRVDEGKDEFVLPDDAGGLLTADNLAEDTYLGHHSLLPRGGNPRWTSRILPSAMSVGTLDLPFHHGPSVRAHVRWTSISPCCCRPRVMPRSPGG